MRPVRTALGNRDPRLRERLGGAGQWNRDQGCGLSESNRVQCRLRTVGAGRKSHQVAHIREVDPHVTFMRPSVHFMAAHGKWSGDPASDAINLGSSQRVREVGPHVMGVAVGKRNALRQVFWVREV